MDPIEQLIDEYGDDAIEALAILAGYEKIPPTIDEFLDNEHYAGKFLGDRLYPEWRSVLRQVYPDPLYSPFLEIAATGSIGTGKSTMCLAGLLYDLCRLLHLKSPHDTFQLIDSTSIVVALMNTTRDLADSVLYAQLMDWIKTSPFFQEQKKKVSDPRKEFLPHKIDVFSGSSGAHALGRAVVSGCLSELNFQGQRKKDQAYQSYVQVKRRMESRFMRGEGLATPGRLWLDSSKNDETGFLENHIKGMETDPNALVVCKAVWEVLGPAGKVDYCGKTFPVFIGSQTRDPLILTAKGSSLRIPDNLILQVPIEYLQSFEQDIYGALRDIAGVSTWSSHKFFPKRGQLIKQLTIPNAATKEIVELSFMGGDRLIDYIDLSRVRKDYPHFIHFDIGLKKDRTGIGGTFSPGGVNVDRFNPTTLEHDIHQDLLYHTDIALGVVAAPGSEVPIYKLKNFIIDLQHAGVHIGGVSADGFQSVNLLQDLKVLGIERSEYISTDKDRNNCDLWKQATFEGRWSGPGHSTLEKEVLELLDLGDKIDHPPKEGYKGKEPPSKDIFDGVVGSTVMCHKHSVRKVVTGAMANYTAMMEKAVRDAEKFELKDHMQELQFKQKRRGRF